VGISIADMHPAPKIVLSIFSPVAFNIAINTMAEAENLKMVIDDYASGLFTSRQSSVLKSDFLIFRIHRRSSIATLNDCNASGGHCALPSSCLVH
jgi:hypothetical protein